MIAYTSSTGINGLAERISAAMPAADGDAALVPKNGLSPATVVDTPSVDARFGFCRTSGVASGLPFTSKKCVIGPRLLNDSGVVDVE